MSRLPLTDLEVASGLVLGVEPAGPPLPSPRTGETPLGALERVIAPALRRPPCLVSFSGGRDSSAVLAAAAALARREGLADPIPATNHVTGIPRADEAQWQELVVAHLGLRDWVRLRFTDELDVVGPYATRVLRRHGLIWPCNAHFHLPLLEVAAGSSLLTGIGGDELFAAALAPPVLARELRPRPRDALALGLALAPHAVRRAVRARRDPVPLAWLTPRARRAVAWRVADETARQPWTLRARLALGLRLRSRRVGHAALAALAADHDVRLEHPLASPEVAAALARATGRRGLESRTAGMRALAETLLPSAVLDRRDKAAFDGAFWTGHARALAEAWAGDGVPAHLVDLDRLAREWRSPAPAPQSSTLLQAAWLARSGCHGGQEPLDRRLEVAPIAGTAQHQMG